MTAVTLNATVTFPEGLPSGGAGTAATIAVGTVTGLEAGAAPTVVNSGTSAAAVLDFGIPVVATGSGGGSTSGSGYSQRLQVFRADEKLPAFKKGSGNTIALRAGVEIEFLGVLYAPTADVPVTLPPLVPGTDYRIAIKTDGTLQAYTYADTLSAGSKVIGGFHHLIGSPSTGLGAGGGWTPTLLEWSIWDITFRPKCDPRGMTRVGGAGFWVDIYFQGVNSNTNGVTGNDDTILTGEQFPRIPTDYGGDGSTKFTALTWWAANEHLRGWGKRLPSYEEMCLAGFGTNEGDGRGIHPFKTGFATYNTPPNSDPNFTSKWGLIQSTGCVWIWTSTLSDWQGAPTSNSHGWEAYQVTDDRGKLILQNNADLTAMLYGGSAVYTSTGSPTGVAGVAGSRCGETIEKLWDNSVNIAMRGACDHYSSTYR